MSFISETETETERNSKRGIERGELSKKTEKTERSIFYQFQIKSQKWPFIIKVLSLHMCL